MRFITLYSLIVFVGASGVAHSLEIPEDQRFCLRDDIGQQFRSCIATKLFEDDPYYDAFCPDLSDPGHPLEPFLITEEWEVVFEGDEGCDPIVATRDQIPYYVPRSDDRAGDGRTPASADENVVRLLFGTNRQALVQPERLFYLGDRDDKLRLGSIAVSVPEERNVGDVDRPWSLRIPFTSISIGFSEDPEEHFSVRWIGEMSQGLFLEQLRTAVTNEEDGTPKQAFIFVHGYNSSFDAAAYRTAQLAYDMQFPGAPIFFSWPSRGEVEDYEYDQQSARTARQYLAEFLTLVREQSGADIVHLIAHSMGNDPLLEALRDLNLQRQEEEPLFNEVILAAPDVDLDLFLQLAKQVKGVADGFTLYANSDDRALNASKRYAGGIQRAGDLPAVIAGGVDTIDISAVGSSLFGLNHSTYAENASLLEDMKRLFLESLRPDARPLLIPATSPSGGYWQLPGG